MIREDKRSEKVLPHPVLSWLGKPSVAKGCEVSEVVGRPISDVGLVLLLFWVLGK